jgi:hypothetical protein
MLVKGERKIYEVMLKERAKSYSLVEFGRGM